MSSISISADVEPFLKIILYFAYHIQEVDENKKSLSRYLRSEYLKKVVGEQAGEFDRALTWSLEHPNLAYNKLLPDLPLSNDQCVKLMEIFRKHIRAL